MTLHLGRVRCSVVGAVLLAGFGEGLLRISLEGDELAHEILVYVHDCGVVVEVPAVVLCAEDSHQLLALPEEPVAVLHDLMPTTY